MEDRSRIREKHGIANARRVASATVADSDTQAVTVTDGFGEVLLSLSSATFPAGLTPDQARKIADQLRASAKRVEKRGADSVCKESLRTEPAPASNDTRGE